MTPIVLKLTGQAPLMVRHISQANGWTITLNDINTSTYTLKLTNESNLAVEYYLKLVDVADVNGYEATVCKFIFIS
jgi:hypothetical protein